MLFVIDTNVFVSSLSSHSQYHWIIEELLDENFEIAVSTGILLEYEEILKQKYNLTAAEAFLQAIQELPNTRLIATYYQWQLLPDEDDNEFVDVAIAANAHYIVTEDNDFNILKRIPFPKVNVLNIASFKTLLEQAE